MTKRTKYTRRFAITTAVGMLIVLLMGARVTATGSGEGCGADWPLCHGSWLPANTYESLTEYSHRIVTGIEGILVAITSVLAWPMRKRYPEVKYLVPAMAGTLVLQSLMGAAAVKWPQTDEVMATHFGISLICLASAALLARVLNEDRPDTLRHSGERREPLARNAKTVLFRRLAIASVIGAIVVAYSGAYVRHTGAELACSSWPTCNGELIPSFEGLHGVQTIHRLGAGLISLLLVWMLIVGYQLKEARPDLFTVSSVAMGLVLVQSLIGAIVVESGLQLMATLAHAGVMALLFVTVCDGVRLAMKRRTDPETERIGAELAGMAVGD